MLKVSFNKIYPKNLEKIFPTKEIPDSFIKVLTETTEGLNSADIENFILQTSKIAMNKNLVAANIDYDCFARALWNIKQIKYKQQLPELSARQEIIDKVLDEQKELREQKEFRRYFLENTSNMTLANIQEIIEKAQQYAAEKHEKTIAQWLEIALNAQNELIKIKQKSELIHLCEKIYNMQIKKWDLPEKIAQWTSAQKALVSGLEPETIFKKFEKAYIADSYLKEYKELSEK